jgi:hypothetical protein
LKTNFKQHRKPAETKSEKNDSSHKNSNKEITQSEFEDFIIKSGAKGSFMVYRSKKEDDELGIDEL